VSDLLLNNPRHWNEPLIKQIFFHHEAKEILSIRIPNTEDMDILAWHFEKNGIFSVRSAHELAMELNSNDCSTSSSADRRNFEAIWATPVPQKIKVFTWKLALNGLAVQTNRLKRHLIPDATCSICGLELENDHHAMVRCTKAVALRHALCQVWDLPEETLFNYTGPGWMLVLLNTVNKEARAKLMFLFLENLAPQK
jgi:hypothetical protein